MGGRSNPDPVQLNLQVKLAIHNDLLISVIYNTFSTSVQEFLRFSVQPPLHLSHVLFWRAFCLDEVGGLRRTSKQSEDPYFKGVDVLLIPQNLARAQQLVIGVPNLFPSPPILS